MTAPGKEQHPLLAGAREYFASGRLSYTAAYLKPAKRLLVDLAVTEGGLDKALALVNHLFLSLEAKGHRVVIASRSEYLLRHDVDERETPQRNRSYNNLWTPDRCTVVYIGTVAIGLTLIEMSEEAQARYVNGEYIRETDYATTKRDLRAGGATWTTTRDFASGRLCLQAYSPYPRTEWVRQWRETKSSDLQARVPAIVKELEKAAEEIAQLAEEAARQAELERQRWEAQRAKWQQEELARRIAQAAKESKEELHQIYSDWCEAIRIEQFFVDMENRAGVLEEDTRSRVQAKLQRARELIAPGDFLDRMNTWRPPEER